MKNIDKLIIVITIILTIIAGLLLGVINNKYNQSSKVDDLKYLRYTNEKITIDEIIINTDIKNSTLYINDIAIDIIDEHAKYLYCDRAASNLYVLTEEGHVYVNNLNNNLDKLSEFTKLSYESVDDFVKVANPNYDKQDEKKNNVYLLIKKGLVKLNNE